jgi:hypothetical protein
VTQKVVLLFLALLLIMPWLRVDPPSSAYFVSLAQLQTARHTAQDLAAAGGEGDAAAAGAKLVSDGVREAYMAAYPSLLYVPLTTASHTASHRPVPISHNAPQGTCASMERFSWTALHWWAKPCATTS